MPYSNVPDRLQGKMEQCVLSRVGKGMSKDAAIAICYKSVVESPIRVAILSRAGRALLESDRVSAAADYQLEHEAIGKLLVERGFLEGSIRHTKHELEIIREVIRLMAELYAGVENLDELLQHVEEAVGFPTVIDYLIASIHRSFTLDADDLFGRGRLSQDERIFLSHAIGNALDAFNLTIDTEMPALRDRGLNDPAERAPDTVIVADNVQTDAAVIASTRESAPAAGLEQRELHETFDGSPTISEKRHPDGSYILGGIVVVEGLSANGNDYTRESLPTAIPHFVGKPIFVDHPTISEARDRPERSEYDKVGRLPDRGEDFFVDVVKEGKHKGKNALMYRNGKLSATADWLATRINEGISGEQSINAHGKGRPQSDHFRVESFVDAFSLDFVTLGAAGGHGRLGESARGAAPDPLTELTVDQLAERRPDLIAAITRGAASSRNTNTQEATMKLTEAQKRHLRTLSALRAAQRKAREANRTARQEQANRLVSEALIASKLPAETHPIVRSLMESNIKRFVEQEGEGEPEPAGALAPTGAELEMGDAPNLELPPDVAELPAEAQSIWLAAYTDALPEGEEQAVHKAWAAVYDAGYQKTEGGEWKKVQPAAPEPAPAPEPEPLTSDALTASIRKAIIDVKEALSKSSGAGKVSLMGGGGGDGTLTLAQSETQLEEAFKGLVPDSQAKLAATGRALR